MRKITPYIIRILAKKSMLVVTTKVVLFVVANAGRLRI